MTNEERHHIFHAYRSKVTGLSSQVAVPTDDISDLRQHGMLTLWGIIPKLDRSRSGGDAYLSKVILGALFDYRRKNLRSYHREAHGKFSQIIASLVGTESLEFLREQGIVTTEGFWSEPTEAPETLVAKREIAGLLRKLICALPKIQQDIVRARYYDDVPPRGLAALMNKKESYTSRVHTQALRTLRHQLEKQLGRECTNFL